MGKQACDVPVIQSSIALLQERFRQLQRAKEMREAREHLRLLSEPERVKPTTDFDPNRFFFHSELLHSASTLPQGPQNLQTDFQSNHSYSQATESDMDRTNNVDSPEVDTSLHL